MSQLLLLQSPLKVHRRSLVGTKTCVACAAAALLGVCNCTLAPLPGLLEGELVPAGFQVTVLLSEYFVNVTLKWTSLVLPWYSGKFFVSPKTRGLATVSWGGMNCWAQLDHWLTEVTPCPPRSPPCRAGTLAALAPALLLGRRPGARLWDEQWV